MYTVRPPFFLPWYYPNFLWRKPKDQNNIFLTFDDGPIPNVTDFVLNTLKKYNVKATFFCIGDNINKHPSIFQRIVSDGHRVGNHTFNHLKGWDSSDSIYAENFWKCQSLTRSNLFRPPYGRIKKSQAKLIEQQWKAQQHIEDLQLVMWDVLSGDFDTQLSPNQCLQNVIKNTRKGSILVFHDSIKAWPRLEFALPRSIEYLLGQGYKFELL